MKTNIHVSYLKACMNIQEYIKTMRQFHTWLHRRWEQYGTGQNPTAPTVRDLAKRFKVKQDFALMMCEDAAAHGFHVSLSAEDVIGDSQIDLVD